MDGTEALVQGPQESGDRVIINENVSGTHNIMCPVRMKYLRKI